MRITHRVYRASTKGQRLRDGAGYLLRGFTVVLVSSLLALPVKADQAARSELGDLTVLPFEQLLQTSIISADKQVHQLSQASSAVSIVTADEIRAYGYRSLDDILSGMRGLYMAHTFRYGSLGGRSFGDPGDYVGRITVLVDGQTATENFFGQSFFGADGILDVDLIDRVEYIPGPGSVGYGNGAFLGVVNIITKNGGDLDGAQVAQEFGSHGWSKSRLSYGHKFDNGLDLVLSASSYSNNGRLFTTDLVTGDQGLASDESNKRLFVKATYQGWSLESAWVTRPVYWPDNRDPQSDDMSLLRLQYDGMLSPQLRFSSGLSWGEHLYDAYFSGGTNSLGDPDIEHESSRGRWWMAHTKFVGTWLDEHTIVFGTEYRSDYQQDYDDRYITSGEAVDPTNPRTEVRLSHATTSAYAYDDYELTSDFELNYGVRYDHRNDGRASLSPRAAAIWKPVQGTVLKLSTGIANRESSAFVESGNPLPRTERILTQELVWEQKLAPRTQLISSIYRYRIDGQTVWDPDGTDVEQKIYANGAELELNHRWDGGSSLKLSYAWQDARNELDHWLFNSPHHNAKLNFTTPLYGERLRLALAARFLSERRQYDNELAPGYGVADLTLTSSQVLPGWYASLSVRNLFDHRYGDVRAMYDSQDPAELRQFPMDGRNYWLQLRRDFK